MKANINKHEIILSVGMIVKNEEKNLKKCLEALSPLLREVKSELVIVDTGSEDNTVNIAKEYTDKVYSFKWIDDFSAARNFGLKKCTGKWFMFLDADDWFDEDLSEMIRFFNRENLNKQYNCAYYITYNYLSQDKNIHSDLYVQRIARRTENLRFTGAIHETFTGFSRPAYYFKTFAHHYGYVYENEEQRLTKMKRNYELLLKKLETSPDDIRIICHLSDCSPEVNEQSKYIEKALDLTRKQTGELTVYAYQRAVKFYLEKEPEKTVLYADEYIGKTKADDVFLTDVYAYKGLALYKLKRYEEAAEALAKYREYYNDFYDNKLDKTAMIFAVINHLSDYERDRLLIKNALCFSAEKRYKEASELLNTLDLVKASPPVFAEFISTLSDIITESADLSVLSEYYNKIRTLPDNNKLRLYEAFLETMYFKSADRKKFASDFADINTESDFTKLMKLAAGENIADLQSFLDNLTPSDGYSEAVYLAASHNADLSVFIKKMKREKIIYFLSAIQKNHADYPRVMLSYCIPEKFLNSIKEIFWAVCALEAAVNVSSSLTDDEKLLLYNNFTSLVVIYVTNVYNPALLNDTDIEILPPLHRFGYYTALALNELEADNKAGYIKNLKEALKTNEDMKDVITVLLNNFLNQQ